MVRGFGVRKSGLELMRCHWSSSAWIRVCVRGVLLTLAVLALSRAGWWVTQHIFFVQLPLADVADTERSTGEAQDFRFDGVTYFKGRRLWHKQRVRHKFDVPTALAADERSTLEIFVRIDRLPDAPAIPNAPPDPDAYAAGRELVYGRLIVSGKHIGEIGRFDLRAVTFQRLRVPLDLVAGQTETLDIQFRETGWGAEYAAAISQDTFADLPEPEDASVDERSELARLASLFPPDTTRASACVAAEIEAPGVWVRSVPWFVLGFVLLGAWAALNRPLDARLLAAIGVTVALSALCQSGGLVSNEYFPGNHGRIAGMAFHTAKLLETGSFGETAYRNGGMICVPLLARVLEGPHALDRGIADVYPNTRYAMWCLSLLATLALMAALRRQFGVAVAVVFGVLASTHHTAYVLSIFHPDADGLLLPLMMLGMACFVRLLHAKRAWVWAACLCVIFGAMLTSNVVPLRDIPHNMMSLRSVWPESVLCEVVQVTFGYAPDQSSRVSSGSWA